MSKSAVRKNSHSKFSFLSWLARIILYGSVFSSVFWPSYLAFESTRYYNKGRCPRTKHFLYNIFEADAHCRWGIGGPSPYIKTLNRKQQAYYLEHNRFADSLKEIEGEFNERYSDSNYRIVQEMVPVQDLHQSLSPDSDLPMTMAIIQHNLKDNSKNYPYIIAIKNYLGVVYTFPDTSASGESEIITGSIACEMRFKKFLPTTMPTMKDGIMQCPNGTKKLREEEL